MQNMVRRVKDPTEKIELLTQNLERKPMRLVVPSNEIDHGNVALLAVPMASPDTLFDALRVPWQIVIDDRLAKLQVQALGAGLGAYEDLRTRAELVHEREPHGDLATGLGSLRKTGTFLLLPASERLLRTLVIVYAAEQGDVFLADANSQQQ